MNVAVGMLLAAVLGLWVYLDARTRNAPRPALWGIGTFLLAIVVLPAWLLTRPRRPQEQVARSGPRRCPACRGPVQPTAAACIHCGHDLPPDSGWA